MAEDPLVNRFVRVNVLVEGTTEETFVRDLLAPELSKQGIYLTARSLGGVTKYQYITKEIKRWLKQDDFAYVTTMIDFYGFPSDCPHQSSAKTVNDTYKQVENLEMEIAQEIESSFPNQQTRFIPYLQLHEFEALLFVDIEKIDQALKIKMGDSRLTDLRNIKNQFSTPELINNGRTTAPSKRLISLYPFYQKAFFGPIIAKDIGLPRLRADCAHFNSWVEKLLQLK